MLDALSAPVNSAAYWAHLYELDAGPEVVIDLSDAPPRGRRLRRRLTSAAV